MGKLVLYAIEMSPGCRSVMLTLKALKLPYEFKMVDFKNGEHMKPEFIARNPQHTVPLLGDDDTWLWDSHAINAYLVNKYGRQNDPLYPKDPATRAIVDQRMHFDTDKLAGAMLAIVKPMLYKNVNVVDKEKAEAIVSAYEFIEIFLNDRSYLASNSVTIADFCCVATIISLQGIVPADPAKYPLLTAWQKRLEALPYFEEACGRGGRAHADFLKSRLNVRM